MGKFTFHAGATCLATLVLQDGEQEYRWLPAMVARDDIAQPGLASVYRLADGSFRLRLDDRWIGFAPVAGCLTLNSEVADAATLRLAGEPLGQGWEVQVGDAWKPVVFYPQTAQAILTTNSGKSAVSGFEPVIVTPSLAALVASGQGRGVDLTDVVLDGLSAVGVDFTGARFTGASLQDADLSNCLLGEADLRDTRLNGVFFDGALLDHANLSGATLGGPGWGAPRSARGIDLSFCQARGAILGSPSARLDCAHANFSGGDFSHADLSRLQLTGALLTDARLESCWLEGAVLDGADLRNVFAQRASLRKCSLKNILGSNANFTEADFSAADLSDSVLVDARFAGCTIRADGSARALSLAGAQIQGVDFSDSLLDGALLLGAGVALAQGVPLFRLPAVAWEYLTPEGIGGLAPLFARAGYPLGAAPILDMDRQWWLDNDRDTDLSHPRAYSVRRVGGQLEVFDASGALGHLFTLPGWASFGLDGVHPDASLITGFEMAGYGLSASANIDQVEDPRLHPAADAGIVGAFGYASFRLVRREQGVQVFGMAPLLMRDWPAYPAGVAFKATASLAAAMSPNSLGPAGYPRRALTPDSLDVEEFFTAH